MKTPREQVVDLLVDREEKDSYAQIELKHALKDVERIDKAFITEVFYGTLKYQLQIDYILNSYSKTKVKKMKPFIRNLLRMSVYQMLYLDKVPLSAAINEAFKLTKKRKMNGLSGFVNGILRTVDRNKDKLPYEDLRFKDIYAYMSIKYSIPEWIIKMWSESYDDVTVEEICKSLNTKAKVCIRVNTLKTDKESLAKELADKGVIVSQSHFIEDAMYLQKTDNIVGIDSFNEGKWTVQDESAMLPSCILNPQSGETILDMCSAPGGKTMHMAAIMNNEGKIVACDIYEHKLELIQKNANRLGINIIETRLADNTNINTEFIGKFDKVLLDAPCSGLGILRRKPDLRLNKTPEELDEIVKIQEEIFNNAVRYLKKGGRLVYSTCSISRKENEDMVKKMLEKYPIELEDITDVVPEILKKYVEDKGMLQILPYYADTDGFFIASLIKNGDIE